MVAGGLILVELTVTCPYVHVRLYSLELMSRLEGTAMPVPSGGAEVEGLSSSEEVGDARAAAEMAAEALATR